MANKPITFTKPGEASAWIDAEIARLRVSSWRFLDAADRTTLLRAYLDAHPIQSSGDGSVGPATREDAGPEPSGSGFVMPTDPTPPPASRVEFEQLPFDEEDALLSGQWKPSQRVAQRDAASAKLAEYKAAAAGYNLQATLDESHWRKERDEAREAFAKADAALTKALHERDEARASLDRAIDAAGVAQDGREYAEERRAQIEIERDEARAELEALQEHVTETLPYVYDDGTDEASPAECVDYAAGAIRKLTLQLNKVRGVELSAADVGFVVFCDDCHPCICGAYTDSCPLCGQPARCAPACRRCSGTGAEPHHRRRNIVT